MNIKLIWKKVYVGPFKKTEAMALVEDLCKIGKPNENLIYDAKIRKRKNTNQYDVFIKTENV